MVVERKWDIPDRTFDELTGGQPAGGGCPTSGEAEEVVNALIGAHGPVGWPCAGDSACGYCESLQARLNELTEECEDRGCTEDFCVMDDE
jgi:hypothetical protein